MEVKVRRVQTKESDVDGAAGKSRSSTCSAHSRDASPQSLAKGVAVVLGRETRGSARQSPVAFSSASQKCLLVTPTRSASSVHQGLAERRQSEPAEALPPFTSCALPSPTCALAARLSCQESSYGQQRDAGYAALHPYRSFLWSRLMADPLIDLPRRPLKPGNSTSHATAHTTSTPTQPAHRMETGANKVRPNAPAYTGRRCLSAAAETTRGGEMDEVKRLVVQRSPTSGP